MIPELATRRTPWRRLRGDGRRPDWVGWSPWVRDLGGVSGVYLLRNSEDHSEMYVGQSRDLRKRIQKHFSRRGRMPFPAWKAEGRVYLLAPEHLDLVEETLILMHSDALNKRRPSDAPPF